MGKGRLTDLLDLRLNLVNHLLEGVHVHVGSVHHGGAHHHRVGANVVTRVVAGVLARVVTNGLIRAISVAGIATVTASLGARVVTRIPIPNPAQIGQRESDGRGGVSGGFLHRLDLRVLGLLLGGDGNGEGAAEEADETEGLDLHGEMLMGLGTSRWCMSVALCGVGDSESSKTAIQGGRILILIPENTVDGRMGSSSGRRSTRRPVNHQLLCLGMTLGGPDHGEIEMGFVWREGMPVRQENLAAP